MPILDLLIEKWEKKLQQNFSQDLADCISDAKATMTGNFRPPNTLSDKCHFKKHKGKLWKEVIEEDPGYADWCLGNIEGFSFDETAHNYLIEMQDGDSLKFFDNFDNS